MMEPKQLHHQEKKEKKEGKIDDRERKIAPFAVNGCDKDTLHKGYV